MREKRLRKLVCKICEEPISAGTICGNCRQAAIQDDSEEVRIHPGSSFQKKLARGFKTLFAPYHDDGLED